MFKIFSIFFLLIFNINLIKTSPNLKQLIAFKHLIKDAQLENNKFINGNKLELLLEKGTNKTFSSHIPQYFRETININNTIFVNPFLLIPLFKIKDNNNEDIPYLFFENDLNNNISTHSTNFPFLGKNRLLSFKKPAEIIFKYFDQTEEEELDKQKEIKLTKLNSSDRNGYLILKDSNSDSSVLYFGVFINENYLNSVDCPFSKLYNYFLFNLPENKELIKEPNVSLELRLNISCLKQKLLEVSFRNPNDFRILYNFNLYLATNIPDDFIIINLKPKLIDFQLYFSIEKFIHKNKIFDDFIKLKHCNNLSKEYYDDFIKPIELN